MRLKGATTVLKNQCEFLGLTWDELMVFIERNPYAMNNKTIDALYTRKALDIVNESWYSISMD